ncbi:MAG: NAD(P)H-dependent oxidoreductase subunit E [Candidatus Kapabacteria bacterium]|nr:NAD(P)H-dependent oxidoreductase subunit E [Candidatus Kapabacteria bacterium]
MSEIKCVECLTEPTEEELYGQLDDILCEYVDKPGALIPVLQITQRIFGYLPQEALKKISLKLKKSYSEVTGVVSFYSFFSTQPRGKYIVRVCLGTACYVRGGKDVLSALKKELKIDVGMTTDDKLFSIDVGRCFGACGLAPVVMVNDEVHQRVKPEKIGELINAYKNAEPQEEFKEVV